MKHYDILVKQIQLVKCLITQMIKALLSRQREQLQKKLSNVVKHAYSICLKIDAAKVIRTHVNTNDEWE